MSQPPDVRYRERLIPGPGWWLFLASLVAMISIAYGAALGTVIGFVVAGICSVSIAVGVVRASPVVEVRDDRLTCGEASLPSSARGTLGVATGDDLARIRRGLDEAVQDRAFTVAPAWVPARAVVVEVTDADDPHSAWVVASRRPDRLKAALAHRS